MSTTVPCGILLLDKPLGLSSNAALQRVRRLAGGAKAGHTGSLDPLATGMLPICLGEATKLAGEMLTLRKAYRFGLLLGERSDTGDAQGQIIERAAVPAVTAAQIEAALAGFRGPQQQIPPMYSALKRNGEPLYRLARRGIDVPRAPRAIVIDRLELHARSAEQLELEVLCSKGTYVRVLAEDIARALGTCGRLDSLRRDYVEPFALERMWTLAELEEQVREPRPWVLLPPDRAVQHFPAVRLSAAAAVALAHGRVLELSQVAPDRPSPVAMPAQDAAAADQLWRLYDARGAFLGLGTSDATGTLRVRRLFSRPIPV